MSEVLVDTYSAILICIHKGLKGDMSPGADPGFEKGGFNVVPKRDTGGATHNYL